MAWRVALPVPWFTLSADDVFRAEHAIEAAGGALLPSDLWPPLPFWLAGGLIRLGVPAWSAAGVTNFLATLVALGLVADTARASLLRPRMAVAAVVLGLTLPWTWWLAWSGLSEPLAIAAHAAVLRGLVDWRTPRGVRLVVGGLCLGGLTRYEAWGDYIVVVGLAWAVRREVAWRWAVAPLVFPAAWLALQAIWTGDPFAFAAAARDVLALDPDTPTGPAAMESVLLHLWQATDVVLILGLVGWWQLRTVARARAPMIFGLSCLLLQMAAVLLHLGGSHTMQRHFVGHGLFLAIGAGALLGDLRATVLAAALSTLLVVRIGLYQDPPMYVDSDLQTLVARLGPALAEHPGKVLVELDDFDSMAVPILLVEPRVVWDREAGPGGDPDQDPRVGRSVLLRSRPALLAWMQAEDVGFVLTMTPRGRSKARTVATELYSVGAYTAFLLPRK